MWLSRPWGAPTREAVGAGHTRDGHVVIAPAGRSYRSFGGYRAHVSIPLDGRALQQEKP